MSGFKLLLCTLVALILGVGCVLSDKPDIPSLQPGDGSPDFSPGTGGGFAGTGGSSGFPSGGSGGSPSGGSGGSPLQNLGGAPDEALLMGGFGGEK